jgi:hypothetical protein
MAVSAALWGASDPLVGTWKFNPQKSNFGARPMPQSGSETWSAHEGDVMKMTGDVVYAQGQTKHGEWSGKFDGRDYRHTANQVQNTMSFRHVDAQTVEVTVKNEGKTAATGKWTISKDGKTLTEVWSGVDEKGQSQSWTLVLDKQ